MKYLLFLVVIIFSCNLDYYPMPYYNIDIPELKNTIKFLDKKESIIEIKKWMILNIKYKSDINNYGIFDYWATPLETMQRKSGDCEDKAILFAWLCYQYYNIKPEFFLITRRTDNRLHVIAYIEKYNFYYGLKKERNNKYFKNGELLINWKYDFEDGIIQAEYFK